MKIEWPKLSGIENVIGNPGDAKVSKNKVSRAVNEFTPNHAIIPGSGSLKYIREVASVLSAIIKLADDYLATIESRGAQKVTPHVTQTDSTVLVLYFPGRMQSVSSAPEQGHIRIFHNAGNSFHKTGLEEPCLALSRDTARTLASLKTNLGTPSSNISTLPTSFPRSFENQSNDNAFEDKYIISIEKKEGKPDIRITRQDISGCKVPLEPDTITDNILTDIIREIAGLRFLSDCKAMPDESRDDTAQFLCDAHDKTGEFSVIVEEIVTRVSKMKYPEINVSSFPAIEPFSDISCALEQVSEQHLLIESSLDALYEDLTHVPADDQSPMAAIKENIKNITREAYHTAATGLRLKYPGANPALFGIAVDERGMLRIDKDMLSGSFPARKDELFAFVRDFGASLHTAIRYDLNPLAGWAISGASLRNVNGPESEKALQDDWDAKKTEYEKRLNELQRLLDTSYELKTVFIMDKSPDG